MGSLWPGSSSSRPPCGVSGGTSGWGKASGQGDPLYEVRKGPLPQAGERGREQGVSQEQRGAHCLRVRLSFLPLANCHLPSEASNFGNRAEYLRQSHWAGPGHSDSKDFPFALPLCPPKRNPCRTFGPPSGGTEEQRPERPGTVGHGI